MVTRTAPASAGASPGYRASVHSSASRPFSNRNHEIPFDRISRPVGGMPMNSPRCVPVPLQRSATLSRSAITSSTAIWMSGKPVPVHHHDRLEALNTWPAVQGARRGGGSRSRPTRRRPRGCPDSVPSSNILLDVRPFSSSDTFPPPSTAMLPVVSCERGPRRSLSLATILY